MNKVKYISLFLWVLILSLIIFSCTPVKNNCGTKKQHKIRMNNTKKMAPSMMN